MAVSNDKRRTKYPYCEVTANSLCTAIAAGGRITELCDGIRFPTYNIICRWRRGNSEFNFFIVIAYKDRTNDLKILNLGARAYKSIYKRTDHYRQIGTRYPETMKEKIDKRRVVYFIETGINTLKVGNGNLLKVK